MSDPYGNQIRRGLALVAVVIVVIVLAALAFGRKPADDPPENPVGQAPLVVDTQPLPLPPPPLSRAELIGAAARAASAAAAGKAAPPEDAALAGRTFRLAIPFGCAGPSQARGPGASWSLDENGRTIKLTARPQIWTDDAWVRKLAGPAEAEAIEGFWLPRPWLLTGDCPTVPPSATPPAEELGFAMLFTADSSRLLRRGERPYEHVMNAPAEGAPAPGGYRLVLAGRIVGFADKAPVRCRAADPNRRPVCLFAVAFDRVAFEDPSGRDTLAEWRFN